MFYLLYFRGRIAVHASLSEIGFLVLLLLLVFGGRAAGGQGGGFLFWVGLGMEGVINCNCSRSYFKSWDRRLPLVDRFLRLLEGKCGWTELFATSWGEAAGRSWGRDKYMLV